ncbi:hypothetical protein [Fodinicurvata halophila]|uniref:hypothetical protein n=1 Tax=Fodinicurvata halophila TaxID=1419723 RepID=UPI003638C2DD
MTNMKTSPVTREILERETRTWPEPLRTTWIEAHDPITGDCQWVQQTRYTCARMVTRYLAILTPEEKAGRDCLLQRHQLKKFLIEAEKTASIRTLFTNVHSLNMAAGILYPERMAAETYGGCRKQRHDCAVSRRKPRDSVTTSSLQWRISSMWQRRHCSRPRT